MCRDTSVTLFCLHYCIIRAGSEHSWKSRNQECIWQSYEPEVHNHDTHRVSSSTQAQEKKENKKFEHEK